MTDTYTTHANRHFMLLLAQKGKYKIGHTSNSGPGDGGHLFSLFLFNLSFEWQNLCSQMELDDRLYKPAVAITDKITSSKMMYSTVQKNCQK